MKTESERLVGTGCVIRRRRGEGVEETRKRQGGEDIEREGGDLK